MEQLPGFVHRKLSHHVCLMHKSFYGLKQTPYAWFAKLSNGLIFVSSRCSKANPSLFIYNHDTNFIRLLVYVNDMILTSNASSLISQLMHCLNKEFTLKDLGNLLIFSVLKLNTSRVVSCFLKPTMLVISSLKL